MSYLNSIIKIWATFHHIYIFAGGSKEPGSPYTGASTLPASSGRMCGSGSVSGGPRGGGSRRCIQIGSHAGYSSFPGGPVGRVGRIFGDRGRGFDLDGSRHGCIC